MVKELLSAIKKKDSFFFHTSIAYAVHAYNYWGKMQGKPDQLCLLKDVICSTLTTFLPKYGII